MDVDVFMSMIRIVVVVVSGIASLSSETREISFIRILREEKMANSPRSHPSCESECEHGHDRDRVGVHGGVGDGASSEKTKRITEKVRKRLIKRQ